MENRIERGKKCNQFVQTEELLPHHVDCCIKWRECKEINHCVKSNCSHLKCTLLLLLLKRCSQNRIFCFQNSRSSKTEDILKTENVLKKKNSVSASTFVVVAFDKLIIYFHRAFMPEMFFCELG